MNKNFLIAALVLVILFLLPRTCKAPEDISTKPNEIPKVEVAQAAKEIGVKPEQVRTLIKYRMVTRTHTVSVIDSNGRSQYKDPWTSVKAEIKHDTLALDIQVRDSIQVAAVHKKTGLFGLGEGKTLIDIRHSNPNVQVNDIRSYEVKVKPKRYSLGIGIGYGWNGQAWQPTIGITLSKSIIRF